ncbi:ATP-binding protein [Paenibacillus sp. NPDC058071]|uniref:hybrid sensor histidine kinase/response regulator n=1 Tax=Paenibacillus sp. NPDC058071 TaxID=3346326 RepID=UPI0036D9F3FF
MSLKKIIWLCVLLLFVLTAFRLLTGWPLKEQQPSAANGVLDLTTRNLEKLVTLDGEWEYFPGTFLKAGSSGEDGRDPLIMRMPISKSHCTDGDSASCRYGTYRLMIRLPSGGDGLYGIRMPDTPAASELYIDGNKKLQTGRPAASADKEIQRVLPAYFFFHSDKSSVEVVVHVSNHIGKTAGWTKQSIKFGAAEAIGKERAYSYGMEWIACAILLMLVIYSAVISIINRQMRTSLLYFVGAIGCSVLSILIDDEKQLLSWFSIPYEWSVRLTIIAYMGIALFFLQFIKNLFPLAINKRVQDGLTIFGLASIAVLTLSIPFYQTIKSDYLLVLMAVPYFFVPAALLRITMKFDRNAIYLVLGATAIAGSVGWGIAKNIAGLNAGYYPFDTIAASLLFAAYWFKRFFDNASETRQLADQLKKTDKLKDEFLANTSHELRTPLHGIVNIAQTMLDNDKKASRLGAENKDYLELLITVGRRMSLLLNDLLDINQLRENRIRLHKAPVRIQSIVSGVLDIVRVMSEGRPIRFEMAIEDDFPAIGGDEKRLVQIMFNLLHNALKFTEKGLIRVTAETSDNQALIHVSDTGAGMSEAELTRVFRPYEQGDPASQHPSGGIGLGLSICKQLIELHGGTLSVRSELGRGSVFSFAMPLQNATDAASSVFTKESSILQTEAAEEFGELPKTETASSTAFTPESGSDKPAVLVVDDDPVNLKVLRGILASEGYRITSATSGSQALERIQTTAYSLVVADVMMPGMSGYELTARIREQYSQTELPVLLLTARSRPADTYSGFRSGANDYVVKPVDANELRMRVRALVGLKQSVEEQLQMEAAYHQARIQPHFLFNTLNSITALSRLDSEKMYDLIEAFSDYLRISFNLWNSEQIVPIRYELDLLKAYLFIEQERFGERLRIDWKMVDSSLFIPPLTIQPLVENAVRHGAMSRGRGGSVRIRIEERDGCTVISVIDSGKGMSDKSIKELLNRANASKRGIGISNTDRRLKKTYGSGLRIRSKPGLGTCITFEVPAAFRSEDER